LNPVFTAAKVSKSNALNFRPSAHLAQVWLNSDISLLVKQNAFFTQNLTTKIYRRFSKELQLMRKSWNG